jgi:hypothetical protein
VNSCRTCAPSTVTDGPLSQAKALACEDIEKACDMMDDLIRLELDKIETIKKLKRCFRIAQLAGVHPNDMKGQVNIRHISGKSQYRPWVGAKVRVDRVGDWHEQNIVDRFLDRAGVKGEEHWLTDVHEELWPEDVLKAYKQFKRGQDFRRRQAEKG